MGGAEHRSGGKRGGEGPLFTSCREGLFPETHLGSARSTPPRRRVQILAGSTWLGGTNIALILFVEYHRTFRETASVMMNQEPDLEVVSQAGSAAEGRQKMAEGGIDAAIVNIPLPDEGAAELVRELHEANPSIPVLVLTHLEDQEGLYEKFLKAGANEVLPKTLRIEDVFAAVRRLGGEG